MAVARVFHSMFLKLVHSPTDLGAGSPSLRMVELPFPTIGPSPWLIENNTIMNNILTSRDGSDGGGLDITGRGRVVNNVIKYNSSTSSAYGDGGGVVVYG